MSSTPVSARGPIHRINYRIALVATAVLTSAWGFGLLAGTQYLPMGIGLIVWGLLLCLGIARWQFSMLFLVVYIPFSGVATVLLYPNYSTASLIKDFAFILPAYLGFVTSRKPGSRLAPFPWLVFWLFVAVILLQSFNPNVPSQLVALIGIKTWLWYIPMYFLGFALINSRDDLSRVLRTLSLTSILPATIGIAQAVLIYSGNQELAYSFYGDAASAMTQEYTQFRVPDSEAVLRRVPSTFPFIAQYYLYLNIMLVAVFGWWQGFKSTDKLARAAGAPIFGLLLIANLSSGARGAFIFLPLLLILVALFSGVRLGKRTAVAVVVAPIAAFAVVGAVLGSSPGSLISYAYDVGRLQYWHVFIDGFSRVGRLGLAGFGTGSNTNAARFFTPEGFNPLGWEESWYVKSFYELGIMGLVLTLLFIGRMFSIIWKATKSTLTPDLRPFAAAATALIAWTLIYGIKGSHLEFDPLNLYFWLFAGIAVKLHLVIDAPRHDGERVLFHPTGDRPRTKLKTVGGLAQGEQLVDTFER